MDLAQKILSLAVHLSQVEETEYAVELFTDVVNGMGLGVTFRYIKEGQKPGSDYISVRTKHEDYGYLMAEHGSLSKLSKEQVTTIISGAKLLGVILEYHSERKNKKPRKNRLKKMVAPKAVEVAKAQALAHVGSWSIKIPNKAIEWSRET